MQWDLGLQALGTLLAMSLIFGVFAAAVFWGRSAWWIGIVATAAFFVLGIVISEVWFGWATEEDLQPNIDGLSFDEVLLIGYPVTVAVALVLRYLMRGRVGRPAVR